MIVPVDKASNNFGIVCKKFSLEVIQKELGISYNGNVIGNKVYIPVCQEASDIYKFHKDTLLHVFDIKLLDENQKIPLLYWTSKQHKDPYRFRFIAGASHCYNKQIAVDLSLALKCIKIHFRNYCKVIQKRRGISFFWSVDNSLEFIDKISDIKTAHSIKTFDFSTLYTNLPLDVIYGSLKSLVMKMFANSKSIAILVNSYRKRHSGLMVPATLAIENIQLINYLKHWKLFFSIRIYNLMVLFLNRYLAYLWVEMHHPSLPIYTYHGVNIAMWLN